MSILGIPDARILRAVAAVTASGRATASDGPAELVSSPGEAGADEFLIAVEVFARAAWSGIAEPGDRAAGLLVAGLGAFAALEAVVDRREWSTLVDFEPGVETLLTESDWQQALERFQPRLSARRALESLDHAARLGARLVVPGDAAWPRGFDDLGAHAPVALWLRGSLEVLASCDRSLALVGARAATGYGEHVAAEAAAGLADRDLTVVSGAAYGIDGMAHRSALASRGRTIAFLAGGPDRLYPAGHEELLQRIIRQGAVVSELPCGQSPTRWRFLQRNRLIAAASSATVVVEAGRRSGSLNTAGHAAALGRPLGAVPGPVTSPASAGCHRLIREFDAVCVTDANEMAELALGIDELADHPAPGQHSGALHSARPRPRTEGRAGHGVDGPSATASSGPPRRGAPASGLAADPRGVRVLDALSLRSARTSLEVAAHSGLAVSEAQEVLGLLGARGLIEPRGAGWVRASPR